MSQLRRQSEPREDNDKPGQPASLMEAPITPEEAASNRIHYLDWLNVLAVLGVFFYHSLQPFSTHDWHVKNSQLSAGIDAVVSFVDPWGVAFFFLIAGASSFLALRWRTAGQYVRERLMRLLLPLTVAYLLLSPVQAFIEERHFGRYTGSFIAGLPLFFQQVYSELPSTLFHPLLVDRTYHLWFVVFLLWFALFGLPLFLWLRAPGRRPLVAWLGEQARWRGSTMVLGIPLMFVPLAVLPLFPGTEDWGTFVYLFGFFVAGHVLMSETRLMEAVRRDVALAAGDLGGRGDGPYRRSSAHRHVAACTLVLVDLRVVLPTGGCTGMGLGPLLARTRDAGRLVPATPSQVGGRSSHAVLPRPSTDDPCDRVLRCALGCRDPSQVGCDRAGLISSVGTAGYHAGSSASHIDDVRRQAAKPFWFSQRLDVTALRHVRQRGFTRAVMMPGALCNT